MGKKRNRLRSKAPSTSTAVAPTASATMPSLSFGGNGFQGADFSKNRGYVYFPTLDTRREINTYNRTELMRRARFMVANNGLARSMVNGTARMVVGKSGLMPRPITSDEEWNEANAERHRARASSPTVWHLGEKYTSAGMQRALVRCGKKDGDAFIPLSESDSGLARFGFYEAHQIGPSRDQMRETAWLDGVLANRHGASRKFRVLGDNGTYVDIDAADMIHYADFERAGQRRGVTGFYHAVNKMLDIAEIERFLIQGIKVANRVGYYWRDKNAPVAGSGVAAALGRHREQVQYGDKTFELENVYGDGGEIPEAPPGKELALLADARPHPNTMGFVEHLIRDCALGWGLPSEVVWNIAALGGANTRYTLAAAQSFIEEEQQRLVDIYCQRAYVYETAKAMKRGIIRQCRDPHWWKVAWIPPARTTVDFGKDGKLMLEQVKRGLLSYRRIFDMQGLDAWPEVKDQIDFLAKIKTYAINQGLTEREYHTLMFIDNTPTESHDPEADKEEAADLERDKARQQEEEEAA